MREVYLDNSATTFVDTEVIKKIKETFDDVYGNPSSLHRKGLQAEKLVKEARRKVAQVLHSNPDEIVFTSGGTESNNLAVKGCARSCKRKGNGLITTKIEHPSVLNTCKQLEEEGFNVTYLDVDSQGIVSCEQLKESITQETILVSIMYVNNEVGSIQPIDKVSKIIKEQQSCLFHVDGVQAFGKLKIDLRNLGIDLLSISGHKINGPKGIGALYIKEGVKIKPLFGGGEQEKGIRSGTENVSGITGLGKAAEIAYENLEQKIGKIRELKNQLYNGIITEIKDIKLNGPNPEDPEKSSPHILNVSFLGVKGEVLVHSLEEHGIYVSTGSACSSRKNVYSHVLKAMGLKEEEVESAIRFSLSPYNTQEDIDFVISRLKQVVKDLRKIMRR